MRLRHIAVTAVLVSLRPVTAARGSTVYSVGDCVTVTPGTGASGDPGVASGDIGGADWPKQFDPSRQVHRVHSVIHDPHGECRGSATAIQFEDDPNGVVYCLTPAPLR